MAHVSELVGPEETKEGEGPATFTAFIPLFVRGSSLRPPPTRVWDPGAISGSGQVCSVPGGRGPPNRW